MLVFWKNWEQSFKKTQKTYSLHRQWRSSLEHHWWCRLYIQNIKKRNVSQIRNYNYLEIMKLMPKGQLISKADWHAIESQKKWRSIFLLFCFSQAKYVLGESTVHQSTFGFIWHLEVWAFPGTHTERFKKFKSWPIHFFFQFGFRNILILLCDF